jgi:hypothetical protein
MTLVLNDGTKGISVKTHSSEIDERVQIGDLDISQNDFWKMVGYVIENTDLTEDPDDDPRIQFIKRVGGARQVKGYNRGRRRIRLPEES